MGKKLAALGVAVGVVGGGAAGVALGVPGVSGAQSASTTSSADASKTAPDTWIRGALKPLLDDKTLNQDQVDAVVKALDKARPAGGHRELGGRRGADLSVAANAIGVTADELRQELQSAKSMADVAKSREVDPQKVVDALVAQLETHLDAEVTAEQHTQAEADQILADAKTRVTDVVNAKMPAGRGGFRGGPQGGPHGGFGPGDASGSAPA